MLKLIFSLISVLLVLSNLNGQKEDYNWLFGFTLGDNVNPSVKLDPDWGATNIDFNFDPPRVFYDTCRTLDFGGANSSISNSKGELLFFSNGQVLVDKENNIFEDTINYSTNWIVNYPNIGGQRVPAGIPFAQSILSLPYLGSDNIFYVFYLTWEEIENYTYLFRYAIVEKDENTNKFNVIEKDKVLLQDSLMNNGLTACRHANGRDWWMTIINRNTSNAIVYLISPSSIELRSTVPLVTSYSGAIGWKYFSPDGTYYAIHDVFNSDIGNILSLYKFDREVGALSNIIVDTFPSVFLGTSLSFSPDNSKLYANTDEFVYQYDLEADDIKSSRITIAEYDGFLSYSPGGNLGQPTTFGLMATGPDGKIYISAGSGSNRFLHVINKPNELGTDCELRQHSIQLPTSYAYTMPNFPHFRLGPIDGSESDSLGIDNHPIAKFRYTQDSFDFLDISFVNLSYYEPDTYLWDFGGGITSSLENPSHIYDSPGIYEVCLTVSNENSSNTNCQTLQIGTVGTEQMDDIEISINIFPNPALDYVNISFENYLPRDASVKFYNYIGDLMFSKKLLSGRNQIDLTNFDSGVYIINIEDSNQIINTRKLVISE